MPRFTEDGLSLHDERWRFHPGVLMHHLCGGEFMLFTDDTGVVAGHRITGAGKEESEGDQHDGDEGDNDCEAERRTTNVVRFKLARKIDFATRTTHYRRWHRWKVDFLSA
jgi:hypothetical protein